MHLCILDFPNKMKQKKSEALLDTLTALCYCFVWETIPLEYKSLSHTINKSTALEQQEEAGDRKEMGDKTCCSKLCRVKRKKKQWGSRRWVAVWDGKRHPAAVRCPCQGRALPGSPEQPGLPGPKAGTGKQGRASLEGWWEERDPDGKQAAGKKSHSKTLGWTWVCLPRSREGTRMTWPGPKHWGREQSEIWQLRQNRAGGRLGSRVSSPHRNTPLGSALRQRFLAPVTLVCGLPVKRGNRNCCFSSEFLPTTSGARVKNRDPHMEHKEFPLTHTWVTPNTTLLHLSSTFKNLFIRNLRELRILQVRAYKAGQFWTISEQLQLTFWSLKWSDTAMYSPNSQCTNLVLPFPKSWVLDSVQP